MEGPFHPDSRVEHIGTPLVIQKTEEVKKGWFSSFVSGVSKVVNFVGDVASTVSAVAGVAAGVLTVASFILPALAPVAIAVQTVATVSSSISKIADVAKVGVGVLQIATGDYDEAIKNITSGAISIVGDYAIDKVFGKTAEKLAEKATDVMKGAADRITNFMPDTVKKVNDVIEKGVSAVSSSIANNDMINTVKSTVTKVYDNGKKFTDKLVGNVKDKADNLLDNIEDAVEDSKIGKVFGEAFDEVEDMFESYNKTVKNFTSTKVGEKINDFNSSVINSIVDGFKVKDATLETPINATVDIIKDKVTDFIFQ